jgi:hypothetical protein
MLVASENHRTRVAACLDGYRSGIAYVQNSQLKLTIEPRTLNVMLILTVGLMLASFVAYAFVENFAIIRTHL